MLMALKLVQASLLFQAEFIFMVSEHSYLPSDRAFGNTEKMLATYASIICPTLYKEAIAMAIGKRNPVINMERSDFLDIRLLLDHITKRKAPGFSKTSQIVVDGTYHEGYMLKNSYDLADNTAGTQIIRIMLGREKYSPKNFNLNDVNLPPKLCHCPPPAKRKA